MPDAVPPGGLSVESSPGGTHITYQPSLGGTANPSAARSPQAAENAWPQPRIVPLQLDDDRALEREPSLTVVRLETSEWRGRGPDERSPNGSIDPAEWSVGSPADEPVTVLRRGRMRGVPLVVIGIAPVFQQHGQLRQVTRLDVIVDGAQPFVYSPELLETPDFALTGTPPSPHPITGRAVRVLVDRPGLQRITGASLSAAGLDPIGIQPAFFQLILNGAPVALEERGTADGRLDAADELRFYAHAVGDRWNAAQTYWLVVGNAPGARMGRRAADPGAALVTVTAVEHGMWRDDKRYEPTAPGADGDHWFAFRLPEGFDAPAMTETVPITTLLPPVSGAVVVTLTGDASAAATHTLAVELRGIVATASWWGPGPYTQVVTLSINMREGRAFLPMVSRGGTAGLVALPAGVTTAAGSLPLRVSLRPGMLPGFVWVDSIAWQAPVRLSFDNRGAAFRGAGARRRYQLRGVPAVAALYDVTNPLNPQIVGIPGVADPQFEDAQVARDYLLTVPGDGTAPRLGSYSPVDLTSPRNATVVYIAPASLQNELEPLVALRRSQGQTVTVVEAQAIYDNWSYGQVSPDAIRNFLRYASRTWRPAPVYVTLVGDGTSDPLRRAVAGLRNVNIVPPYMAMVDPYPALHETACESCYVQLDGDEPLSDAFPDMAIGRLPVKTAAELTVVVGKIVGYETAPIALWNSRVGYVTDNGRNVAGRVDDAGDFSAMADADAARQPAGIEVRRVYFDPYTPTASLGSWREPDPLAAYTKTVALFNAGAAFINYYGHGHQFQMALTGDFNNPNDQVTGNYLYYWNDTLRAVNGYRLPFVLQMTCLTTAFQTPLDYGETIDERMILESRGGAVGVWGSTGLGVAYGHVFLQAGFYTALWSMPPLGARIGQLTQAGYAELLTKGTCCSSAVRTYALLGDSATRVRIFGGALKRLYLPSVSR